VRTAAIDAVTARFYEDPSGLYSQLGQRGRDACREDLGYHLEFLRPALEFGLIQPMIDYLRWLTIVLAARDVPAEHLPLSLDWFAEFFNGTMESADARVVAAALQKAKATLLVHADAPQPSDGANSASSPSLESEAFEAALLSGNRHDAHALLDLCLQRGDSLLNFELHVIEPALHSIGRKWQYNQVSVAQEHLATALSQAVMTHGLMKSTLPQGNGRKVVLACVQGNSHFVGLQMVADGFQLSGWDVQFLGADVPTQSLVKHVLESKPDLVGLSVSFAQQLRVAKDVMARLTQAMHSLRPPVIIGGLAINQFAGVAAVVGADDWSPDARGAVYAGTKLAQNASFG
jgi:methanogenic corrinoid protein MtbC1